MAFANAKLTALSISGSITAIEDTWSFCRDREISLEPAGQDLHVQLLWTAHGSGPAYIIQ